MNRTPVYAVLAIILLSLTGAGYYFYRNQVPFDEQRPALGEPAPHISLADQSGNMVRLSDYRGKLVLVNFWASWCPPCREELPVFQKMLLAYEGRGFSVIGVAINDVDQPTMKELGMVFPVVVENDRVRFDYGQIAHPPVSFLIGSDGKIVRKVKGVYAEADLKRDIEFFLSKQ